MPGFDSNLEEAWEGPYRIVERKNAVNYKVEKSDGSRSPRIVHVNVLKKCVVRDSVVGRLVVVGELGKVEFGSGVKLKEQHGGLL